MKIEPFSRRDCKNAITKPLNAHKGDSGSVLIIIGSEQYVGAAVLAGMAALRAGADIVGVAAPERAALAINSHTPDIITYKFKGERLTAEHTTHLRRHIEHYTTILLGPGADLGEGLTKELIKDAQNYGKSVILDADASHALPLHELAETIIFVNPSEYLRFVQKNKVGATIEDVHASDQKASKKPKERLEEERVALEQEHLVNELGNNVLIRKNRSDLIFTKERIQEITGGSLRSTVAGTGDVLAGVAAGFRAQGLEVNKVGLHACTVIKRTAELLEEKQHYSFTASDMLGTIPAVLKELKLFRVVRHT